VSHASHRTGRSGLAWRGSSLPAIPNLGPNKPQTTHAKPQTASIPSSTQRQTAHKMAYTLSRNPANLAELALRALMIFIAIIVLGLSAAQVADHNLAARVIVLLAGSILALLILCLTTLWNFWAFAAFTLIMIFDAVLVAVWLVLFVINVITFSTLSTQNRAACVFSGMNMFFAFFALIADWFVGRRRVDSASYV